MKTRHYFIASSILMMLIAITGCESPPPKHPDFSVNKKYVDSHQYLLFSSSSPHFNFTNIRPEKSDGNILLSVAGTYTSPQDTIEGYVILNGEILQMKERQGWDGAAIFKNGSVEIMQTHKGTLLTKEKMAEIAQSGSSLIQAHLLVKNGEPQPLKPQPLFFRRALVVMNDGSPAVIESAQSLDLDDFARDLVSLGVKDAVNLDMGGWSEGWYRDPQDGDTITIGFPNDSTKRQSNWITIRNV